MKEQDQAPSLTEAATVAPVEQPSANNVVSQLLTLQRQAGNEAVGGWFDQLKSTVAEAQGDTKAHGYAKEVYEALQWSNDAPRAIAALEGHALTRRMAIAGSFYQQFDETIEAYLIRQLGEGDDLVQSLALLDSDNVHGDHVALGYALIGDGVRESEPIRILKNTTIGGRKKIETAYNSAYGRVGQKGLRADLIEKLEEDEHRQEALALLDHDQTPAERLYLDSVAVDGTYTDKVVAQIRDTFKQGPEKLLALQADWDKMVVGHKGDEETWTTLTLREAMRSELGGEMWDLVQACFDGLDMYLGANMAMKISELAGGDVHQDKTIFTPTEHARMAAAEGTLKAATTGGYFGAGTNLANLNEALGVFQECHTARIRRTLDSGAPLEVLEKVRAEWAAKKIELTGKADAETSGDARSRAHMMLAGPLTDADQLYLAQSTVNAKEAVRVVTDVWKKGGEAVMQLHTDAGKELWSPKGLVEPGTFRPDPAEGQEQLRSSFSPTISAFIGDSRAFQRISRTIDPASDQVGRGVKRLAFEVSIADGNEELKAVTELLTGVPDALRFNVLGRYMLDHGGMDEYTQYPERAFVELIVKKFEGSTECWNLADLVDPSTNYENAQVRASVVRQRAEGRHEAVHSGWAGWGSQAEDDEDSGADLMKVTDESLARLKFIEAQAGQVEEGRLDELMGQRGLENAGALAGNEAALFKERVEELRKAREEEAEWIAFAFSLATDVALFALTSGGYGAVMFAAMASSAAGMVAKELLLGVDYELADGDNAIELAAAGAAAALSKNWGDKLKAFRGGEEGLEKLGAWGAAQAGMAEKAGELVGDVGARALLNDELPSEDEITAKAIDMVVKLGTSGGGKYLGWADQAIIGKEAARVRASLVSNITGTLSSTAMTAAKTPMDGTGGDWLGKLRDDAFKNITKAATMTFRAEQYARGQDAEQKAAQAEEQKLTDWARADFVATLTPESGGGDISKAMLFKTGTVADVVELAVRLSQRTDTSLVDKLRVQGVDSETAAYELMELARLHGVEAELVEVLQGKAGPPSAARSFEHERQARVVALTPDANLEAIVKAMLSNSGHGPVLDIVDRLAVATGLPVRDDIPVLGVPAEQTALELALWAHERGITPSLVKVIKGEDTSQDGLVDGSDRGVERTPADRAFALIPSSSPMDIHDAILAGHGISDVLEVAQELSRITGEKPLDEVAHSGVAPSSAALELVLWAERRGYTAELVKSIREVNQVDSGP